MSAFENKLMKMLEDRMEDAKALDRVLSMIRREGDHSVRTLSQTEGRKAIPKGTDKVISASMVEMIIGAAPKGITTPELMDALRQNNIAFRPQQVYNFVHYLKKQGRIKTDHRNGKHHAVVDAARQLAAGGEA